MMPSAYLANSLTGLSKQHLKEKKGKDILCIINEFKIRCSFVSFNLSLLAQT